MRKGRTRSVIKLFSKFIAGVLPVSLSLFVFIISICLITGADSNVRVPTGRSEWDLQLRRINDYIPDTAGETAL